MSGVGLPRWVEAPVAALILVAAAPLLLAAVALVKATSRGPALFRQERVGKGGVLFTLVKLRTMRTKVVGTAVTAEGDSRVTSIGRILRMTKVDELPELVHVVTGTMALVGPRPEVPSMVDPSDPLWRVILSVRPGITDPVTIALRNEEELLAQAQEELGDVESFYRSCLQPWKLSGYVSYQRDRTPWSDMKVLWKTVVSVVCGAPVNPPSLRSIVESGVKRGTRAASEKESKPCPR